MTSPSWSSQDDVCAVGTSRSPKENEFRHLFGIIIAALFKVAVSKETDLSLQDRFSFQGPRC